MMVIKRYPQFGKLATKFLKDLIDGVRLKCVGVGYGTVCDGRSRSVSYGRVVAQCFLDDGRDVAAVLVNHGHARDWSRFSNGYYQQFMKGF